MRKNNKMDNIRTKQLDNQELFDLMEKANKQYKSYLKLSSLDYEDRTDNQYNIIRRDINHPLNIVIK